jgi:hypothetical protein
MSTSIKHYTDTDRLLRKIKSLESSQAEANIGILAKDAGKPKQGFKKVGGKNIRVTMQGITLGEVAAFNEFGTKTIPERSFIRSTFDARISEWSAVFEKLLEQVIFSDQSIEWALHTIADKIHSDIKSRVIEISKNDKNSKSTVRRKGKDTPLIATRELIRSIDYEVIM